MKHETNKNCLPVDSVPVDILPSVVSNPQWHLVVQSVALVLSFDFQTQFDVLVLSEKNISIN